MTTIAERPSTDEGAEQPAPALGQGVELLGAFGGSGYRNGSFLVRRGDGQVLQLTPLIYALLELVDGQRDVPALAAELGHATDRTVSAEQVTVLLGKLAALGVLAGSEPEAAPKANPLLALRLKVMVTDARWTRRITAPFAFLFRPWIVAPVLVAFAALCWFVLVDKGLASATRHAFDAPGMLLAIFVLTVVSAGFHELGHAAACRYGGAAPGGMGAGLYLVYPAFYTDVSDAYRLNRRGRLRVDLGGLYFNAFVAVAVVAAWLAVRDDALLLLVAMQLLQMVRQLSPVIRADGYHILADATGVPDLYQHMGPTLRGLLPWHWRDPSPLTRKARVLVTLWVVVVVPVILSLLLGAVLLIPRLIATAWTSGRHQGHLVGHAVAHADVLGALAGALRLFALVLPVIGSILIATRVAHRFVVRAGKATEGRPTLRVATAMVGAVLLAFMAYAWWPSGQYQAVQASERGTIGSLVSTVTHGDLRAPVPASTSTGAGSVATGGAPFRATRRLSLLMVPRGGVTPTAPGLMLVPTGDGGTEAVLTTGPDAGVAFPFALPAAPGPGDQQALALGTQDGGVVYDVEYGLVTVKDGAPATNTNGAYALASCHACMTVAVSFQVVLIVGQSNTIAPKDLAEAANYACPQCITTALAQQLVVTVSAQPSAELMAKLQAALSQLDALNQIDPTDTAAIVAQVDAVEKQVLDLLVQSGLVTAVSGGGVQPSTPPSNPAVSAVGGPSSSTVPGTLPSSASPVDQPSSGAGNGATPSATPSPSPSTAASGATPSSSATPDAPTPSATASG
ncbi:MAG TPA: hypothetical protein VHE83_15495 [Mycobacteriales bacterium]|nr:hypothetical protein [Mycobacteriales bacterium]